MRLFVNAAGQSTCANPITSSQTTVVLQSTGGFPVPTAFQQFTVVILDTGNVAFNAASPLATPYEYAYVTANNTGTNTLTWARGQGGTTPKAFFAGATVAAVAISQDFDACFPRQIDTVVTTASQTLVRLPRSGSIPQNFSLLKVNWFGQSDQAGPQTVQIQFNGDNALPHYYSTKADFSDTTTSLSGVGFPNGSTIGAAGGMPATASVNTGVGEITIVGYNQTAFRVTWLYESWRTDGGASGNPHLQSGGGVWAASPLAVVTDIEISVSVGGFVAGSTFVLTGQP